MGTFSSLSCCRAVHSSSVVQACGLASASASVSRPLGLRGLGFGFGCSSFLAKRWSRFTSATAGDLNQARQALSLVPMQDAGGETSAPGGGGPLNVLVRVQRLEVASIHENLVCRQPAMRFSAR